MNGDTKFIIGVIVATVLVIGGGAYLASRTPAPDENGQISLSEENASRLVQENSPTLGPDDAKVTVVEFGDFECPACGQLHTPLKQIKEQYADNSVRFVFRQFPLTQIHEHAQLAAEASLAAHAQGKFWEMHDAMFENQASLERADLEAYAEEIGLNMDEFRVALDERTYKDQVSSDYADGRAVNVQGTPTLFINGTLYRGQYSVAALTVAIENELAK